MRARDRDLVAGFLAAIALLLGAAAWVDGRIDPGLQLGVRSVAGSTDTQIGRHLDVADNGPAADSGFQAGMIVRSLNGIDLIRCLAGT